MKRIFIKIKSKVVDLVNRANLKIKNADYGSRLKANGFVVLKGIKNHNLHIGNHVTFNSSLKSNPIGYSNPVTLWCINGGEIHIGNNVGISNTAIVSMSEKVIIEDNVMIGGGCRIYNTDFHSIDYENRVVLGDKAMKCRTVHIKEGAFVGAGSTILKGVTIGGKSVVGAGSVVTKSIPDGEIWGGNPARFIKNL